MNETYLIDPEMIPENAPVDAEIEASRNPNVKWQWLVSTDTSTNPDIEVSTDLGVEWQRLPLRSNNYLPDSVRSVLDKPCKVPASFADRVEKRSRRGA